MYDTLLACKINKKETLYSGGYTCSLVPVMVLTLKSLYLRVQHRFSAMQDESKSGGGMRDDGNFKGQWNVG